MESAEIRNEKSVSGSHFPVLSTAPLFKQRIQYLLYFLTEQRNMGWMGRGEEYQSVTL